MGNKYVKEKSSKKRINEDDTHSNKKGKKKNPRNRKILKIIFITIIILIIIAAGIFAGIFFGLFGDDFKITKEDLIIDNMNTVVLDKNGEQIANLAGDENRKIISLNEMPDYLPKAFVSIEDERFYSHHGVDIKRTLGATFQYIIHGGSSSYGGSTITQQLVKNLTQDKEDSGVAGMVRKVKEMSKAYQVEKLISKDQILELYLNIIFLGDQAYGVEVASQYYFNKSAKDLDLAECAFLAGINHSPNAYKPFDEDNEKMQEKNKNRTNTVLAKMQELGQINSQEEYDEAVKEVDNGLKFEKGKITTNATNYSYHTAATLNQVKKELMEKNNWSEEYADLQIRSKGYVIYSTEDPDIQSEMEKEYKKDSYQRTATHDGEKVKSQSAMVVIDHKTGQVVGTVGGLGSEVNATGFNRATQAYRQPGSTIKPIAIIAPGLEEGTLTAGTVYADVKTTFPGGYTPKNEGRYRNVNMTMRKAIELSQNIPHVKAMSDLGPSKSIEYLRKMGISRLVTSSENKKQNDENLSLALGGVTNGISPLEMAAAYATIANDGEYIEPTFYTKVEDRHGNVILEADQERQQVISKQNAYVTKSILTQPVVGSEGTATYCKIPGMDVAAKTGTTNESTDRWLCGFTPYYTAATWYGYDQNDITVTGFSRNPAGTLWSTIMKKIHTDLENAKFEEPSGIVEAKICRDTGLLAGSGCSDTYTEIFTEGTEPTKKCSGGKRVKICVESGKLATEYCPETKYRTYSVMPETEENGNWDSQYGSLYSNPPTKKCDIHTEETVQNNTTSNEVSNNTSNSSGNTNTDGNTNPSGNTVVDKPDDDVDEGTTDDGRTRRVIKNNS